MSASIQYQPRIYAGKRGEFVFRQPDMWHTQGLQMKSFLSLLIIAAIGLQAVSQEQDEVVRVRSNEVRLDVVVKDKKGRPIRDLKASDFEILEDGVPQKVESFRFVSRETTR